MTASVARPQFTEEAPLEAQLASALATHPYRVVETRIWLNAHHLDAPPVPQGWKLHISARPSTLLATLERALPVLIARRCSFKLTRSTEVLRELNSAGADPGAVGKALTVYPLQPEAREVAEELADALDGFDGPRIRSDQRLRRRNPVHYRYGPISARFRALDNGGIEPMLTAPDGTMTSGVAGPSYTVPEWAENPFATPATDTGSAEQAGTLRQHSLLGGRYEVTAGISRSARGIICRARDVTTGQNVVVKQAYSFIGEDAEGVDIRGHLRNERRVLEALVGVPGVPVFVDHFAHSDSEFLVASDVGATTLRQDVADSGTYSLCPTGERSLPRLAASILSVLDAVHQRGVIVRDLAPKNIIIGASGDLSLIDFEISRFDGLQCYGWTPGYSAPSQRANLDATSDDDYFSLGATLAYAATGMDPICIAQDPTSNVAKTLHVVTDVIGDDNDMVDIIAGLLSAHGDHRRDAAAAIRQKPSGSVASTYRRERADVLDANAINADLLGDAVRHTAGKLVSAVRELINGDESAPRSTSAYLGSAGMGLELLYHREQPGVTDALTDLATWTARSAPRVDKPRGLYFGSMGTAIFLASVGVALRSDTFLDAGLELVDREIGALLDEDRDDHIHGLAGLGTGYLILHHLTGDENHVTAARHCAERLLAGRYQATDFDDLPDRRSAGIDARYGFGHGLAGVAEFLLSCSVATGDSCLATAARDRYSQLLDALGPLLATAHTERARPMSVSWCQGLAGIGTALTRATVLGDGSAYRDGVYFDAAQRITQACLAVAPRVPLVTQCCGLSGLGEFMLDMAAVSAADQEESYRAHARLIASYILTRSGGTWRQPVFTDHSLLISGGEWAIGFSGVLSFFRRLYNGDRSRLWVSG